MKKVILKTLFFLFFISCISQSSVIVAKKTDSLKNITPVSKEWMTAKVTHVIFYPQTTVVSADKKANELNVGQKAKKVSIRTLYDDKQIAFLLEWSDNSKSVQKQNETDSYSDGFAVEFADPKIDPLKLPYIGMGSEGRQVEIFFQKAHKNSFESEVSISEGYATMLPIKEKKPFAQMKMEYTNGTWKATLIRPIKDLYTCLDTENIPVAFAIWDGEKLQRDGLKLLSSWVVVDIYGSKNTILSKVIDAKSSGDAAVGKTLVRQNCAVCHRYEDIADAPLYMAPDLSNIGGYATAAYLTESIVDPSAVIVAGYNKNAHKNLQWFTIDKNDTKISVMPSFSHLSNKEILDIVAFLQTLKAEVEK